ncbi:MAG: BPSS1780 family membrane protein [Gammaproteobacteria bacterium]
MTDPRSMTPQSDDPSAPAAGPQFERDGFVRPVEHGWRWLAAGWDSLRRDAGLWVGMMVVFILINLVAQFIPFIGTLLMSLLFPVFAGGFMLGCRAQEEGSGLEFGHLFAGFREHTPRLVVVGAVSLAGAVAATLLMLSVLGSVVFSAMTSGAEAAPAVPLASGLLAVSLALAVMVPVYMAIWFAPALIVLQDAPAVPALKASFAACLKNFPAFMFYGVVLMVLAFLATLPFLLGWLVLGPVVVGSVYAAYRDIYFQA